MALGRVKSWVGGEVLTANDLNAEFNNILNNPLALVSPTTGAINFNGVAHTGLLPGVITGTSGSTGQSIGILQSGTVGFVNVGQAVSRVSGLVGTLSSQTGTFSADGYVMRSSSALTWYVSATSAYSASVGTAGPTAGGRDKAGVFASTEVHWYAITTGPGSTAPAGLVSSQAPPTGPVLPAGYAGWTYLGGCSYTSASTTVFTAQRFHGSVAFFDAGQGVLSNGTSTAETTVSFPTVVPSNASRIRVHADEVRNGGGGQEIARIRYATGVQHLYLVTADRDTSVFEFPNVNRTILYAQDSTNGGLFINLVGYVMPNGDV